MKRRHFVFYFACTFFVKCFSILNNRIKIQVFDDVAYIYRVDKNDCDTFTLNIYLGPEKDFSPQFLF